jgi:hypothetical protein
MLCFGCSNHALKEIGTAFNRSFVGLKKALLFRITRVFCIKQERIWIFHLRLQFLFYTFSKGDLLRVAL